MSRFRLNFLLLLIASAVLATSALRKDTPILVIGAGAAGVSAIAKLLENGFTNVTMLEAGSRIGGRIVTIPFADNFFEVGAAWVHGQRNNVVWEMVKDHNVLSITPDEFFVGWPMSSEALFHNDYSRLFEICDFVHTEAEGCENFWATSYGSFFMNTFNREMNRPINRNISPANSRDFVRFFEKYVSMEDASDSWNITSASGCDEFQFLEGEQYQNWKDNGFRTMFDFITKKRPDPSKDLKVEAKTQFDKVVSQIDYRNDNNVRVTCTDGSVYEAAHVISTLPLGVMKANHSTMFLPPLPPRTVNAIEALQFGTSDKIALEFDRPFWPRDFTGLSLIWTPTGLAKVMGTPFEWTKGLIGFYSVSYQPRVLVGFITGPDARNMELLSNDEILKGVMYVLNEFIGFMRIRTPIRIVATRWHTHPHFRGSLSSRTVEADLRNAFAFDLSIPLNNSMGRPTVLFAGEATHQTFYSTVHAAVESGQREARRLMSLS